MPIQITVAEPGPGQKRCPHCKGRGVISKYDMGWKSLMHLDELAALHECTCGGIGLYNEIDGEPFPPLLF